MESAKIRVNKETEREKQKMESLERTKRTLTAQVTKKKDQINNGRKQQRDLQHEYEVGGDTYEGSRDITRRHMTSFPVIFRV